MQVHVVLNFLAMHNSIVKSYAHAQTCSNSLILSKISLSSNLRTLHMYSWAIEH